VHAVGFVTVADIPRHTINDILLSSCLQVIYYTEGIGNLSAAAEWNGNNVLGNKEFCFDGCEHIPH
jgi:hypothetical protein